MGILDDALSSQDAKRSQRLNREARKSKIEANKIKEGTYRGIDLVDGTARIQLDGQSTTTSGYRLITNAPLGDGDRVSIRPNGVGLPRADARNVAPKVEEIVDEVLFTGVLSEITATFARNTENGISITSPNKLPVVEYSHNSKFKFIKKSKPDLDIFSLVGNGSFEITQVDSMFIITGNLQTPPTVFSFNQGLFTLSFGDVYKPVFDGMTGLYDGDTSPIEVDAKINGVNVINSRANVVIEKAATGYNLNYSTNIPVAGTQSSDPAFSGTSLTQTFSFRWRKRGVVKWLSF